jgi:hypothetical protein
MPISSDIFSSPEDSTDEGRRHPNEFTKVSTNLWDSSLANSTIGNSYEDNPTI